MKIIVTATVERFLDALFSPEDGCIELRVLPSARTKFVQPGDVAAVQKFIASNPNQNAFFGVAARRDSTNGRLENCSFIRALFADVDFKDFDSPEDAQHVLDGFPIQPSIVVHSGNGLHPYWILDEPVNLQRDHVAFRSLLRRMAGALGADLAAAEPARVLRIPGTLNRKSNPPKDVVLVSCDGTRTYQIEDFDEFLPPEPKRAELSGFGNNNGAALSSTDRLRQARAYARKIPGAVEGQNGDNDTFRAACKLLRGFNLSESETFDVLASEYNTRCQPPWTERELQETIRSAERYGQEPVGGRLNGDRPAQRYGIRSEEADDEPQEPPRPTRYSDDALASLFSDSHKDDFLYIDQWGWVQWTGTRWQRVPDVVVMSCVRQVCRSQSELCKVDPGLTEAARQGLARGIASAKVVAGVTSLARTDMRHYRASSQFDVNLWQFNTPGGTIDLKTGELGPHRKADLITKIANAAPQGECPRWLAFLDRVTDGNEDLQSYLQRLAGYALVGDPSEECVDFFYGMGGNGKGTFLRTLQHIFGEYGTTAQTETFLEARGERHPTDIAKLAGARLVVAQEIDEGQRWNESRLKTLTGRDVMTARFMRRDLFDFTPQFTLIISGNNKPSLKTVDEAWRRRLHLVPFLVNIPKAEQNLDLKDELLAEADGILAWAVAGCLDWQRNRLSPPEAVQAATAEYLADEDTFEIWLSECCIRGHEGYEEPVKHLHTSYRRWTESRGERPPSTKKFSQRLKKYRFQEGQETTGARARLFSGVRLTDEERCTVKAVLEAQKQREQGHD